MAHVQFSNPTNDQLLKLDEENYYNIPANNNLLLTINKTANVPTYQHITNYPTYNNQKEEAKNRVFVESSDGEYFGLNTTLFRTHGLIGGMYKKLTNYYENTAQVKLV